MDVNFNKVEFIRSAVSPRDFLRDGLPQLSHNFVVFNQISVRLFSAPSIK